MGNPIDSLLRVLFTALLPAVRIGANGKIPLKDVKRLIELAYFQEARRRGLKMREIRQLMSVSMAKVGLLSKELKAHWSEPYVEHDLPQRIIALLWAGPLSHSAIAAALEGVDNDAVAEALAKLVARDELVEVPGRTVVRYRLNRQAYRLVDDGWMARLSGANDLMRTTSRALESRLVDGDERALARTLRFRARPEDLEALQRAYEEHIFPLVTELDSRVEADAPSVGINLSYVIAPEPGERDVEEDD